MRIMHSPLTAPEVVPDSRSPRHFCPLALELLRSSNGFHLRTAPGPCFGVCVTSDYCLESSLGTRALVVIYFATTLTYLPLTTTPFDFPYNLSKWWAPLAEAR